MGDRFYSQMLADIGTCPGATHTQLRRKNMAWTDEKKAQAIEMYQEQNPTPENTIEIIKEIAQELNESDNGVRLILSKAGVYIKKAPAAKSATKSEGSGRTSKAEAIEALTTLLESNDVEVDEGIITKLTGKAAKYFTDVITQITK